jgi:exodeoxyribonuclease VII small subunit
MTVDWKIEMNFENKLNRLETIIESLDSSEIGLDEMVAQYKEGMSLVAELKKYLDKTEQKIIDITRKAEDTE